MMVRIAFAVLAYSGSALAATAVWGQPVVGIRLTCDAQLNPNDFAAEIIQKVGEPLTQSKVSESLKRLYATGRFLDLRADVEPKGEGVELVFVGRAVFFSGVVQVEGAPKSLDPRLLINASRLRLGEPLSEDELEAASKRLAGVLAENGYYEARVEYHLTPDRSTQEAEIVFSVEPGPAARLRQIKLEGQTLVPPERVARIAGWKPGQHLTSARVERGLFRIQKFYRAQGRLQAAANVQKRVYGPPSHTETLMLEVKAGPLIRVRVQGAHISKSKLGEVLPVFTDGIVDDASLRRGENLLGDFFQRQGYFAASAKGNRVHRAQSQEYEITYQVDLGERGEFMGYSLQGNRSVTKEDLTATIHEETKAPLTAHAVFSQELLARYVEALKRHYEYHGFLDARVTPRLDHPYHGKPNHLLVTFEIDERPRTTVRQLVLEGVDAATQSKIWPSLLTKNGEPYSPTRAQADRDFILRYLADRGYTRANVNWNASAISPEHKVDVQYQIDLGPQERIRRVVVMGNEHTRTGVIRRELAVERGEPLSQSDLLESQRRLYDLGVFNQVQISTQDTQSPETDKTLLVSVEEARRWTVGYGGGIEVQRLGSDQPQGQFKASPRLSLDINRLNVGGRAQTFTLRGRLSNLEKGGSLGYLISRLPTRQDLRLRLNGLVDRSRDVLTFTAEREEASFSLEKRYSPATLLVGRFSFRRVLVDPSTLRISREAIPLFSRPARVAMLAASYAHDTRDNPTDAAGGTYTLADAGVSWDKFGSEANFFRFSGQNATYRRLASHLIFARNTRFQVESRFGTSGRDIPLPERFFMGGSESHRGFSINQAGPRDPETGFPIGGRVLFFNSLEMRLPATSRFGFVFFHDAGNVYSTIRRMRLLKVNQTSPTDFDYTVHAVGFGIRYRTPVGPLRFDVGYSLNPPLFQVINRPNPNTTIVEVRRLSNFQFFLSFGQSF